jgi:hypothetical protein
MGGLNDILLDMALPGFLMRFGLYKFKLNARLEDDTCLFSISLTQELKGRLNWTASDVMAILCVEDFASVLQQSEDKRLPRYDLTTKWMSSCDRLATIMPELNRGRSST